MNDDSGNDWRERAKQLAKMTEAMSEAAKPMPELPRYDLPPELAERLPAFDKLPQPELPEGLRRALEIPQVLSLENNAPRQSIEQPAPAIPKQETKEQRQQRRYQMCIDAGLKMPDNDYARLPDGVGDLAKQEGITRQSFSEDVKAHIRRLSGR